MRKPTYLERRGAMEVLVGALRHMRCNPWEPSKYIEVMDGITIHAPAMQEAYDILESAAWSLKAGD